MHETSEQRTFLSRGRTNDWKRFHGDETAAWHSNRFRRGAANTRVVETVNIKMSAPTDPMHSDVPKDPGRRSNSYRMQRTSLHSDGSAPACTPSGSSASSSCSASSQCSRSQPELGDPLTAWYVSVWSRKFRPGHFLTGMGLTPALSLSSPTVRLALCS